MAGRPLWVTRSLLQYANDGTFPSRPVLRTIEGQAAVYFTTSRTMVAKADLAAIVAGFLAFTTAGLAEQSGPATIDLQKTCRVTEKAVAAVFGDAVANVFDRCVENEKAAREQLVKDWSTY